MASTSNKTTCSTCNINKITFVCQGCSKRFCVDDLSRHRENLREKLSHLQNELNQLRQNLNDQQLNPTKHSFMKQIEQWQQNSIEKIKQVTEQCIQTWLNCSEEFHFGIEKKSNDLAKQINNMHEENEFNEIDLTNLKRKLEKLKKGLNQPTNVSIQQQPTSFLTKISLRVPFKKGKISVTIFRTERPNICDLTFSLYLYLIII